MGFLDRLLGRKERDPNVPEPTDAPATDTNDHPEGEEQAGGPPADHVHDDEH